ncbi:MAG: hypothetical protein AB1489_19955 [Acidobacteriota bacterium]
MAEDFVEVNVQPLGNDSGFGIDLRVQDSTLDPNPFDINLKFELEDGYIPGLNDDVSSEPEQIIELAKGLLLCGSDEKPDLSEIPSEDCPPGRRGVYYNLDIEMEVGTGDNAGQIESQQWQVSILQSPIETPIPSNRLLEMIQEFFMNHL